MPRLLIQLRAKRLVGAAMDLRLSDSSRVCIVGSGPAGSFAALHLLDQARRQGLQLEVLIFEPRDFTRPGPAGCNRCAGILSSRLLRGLEELGMPLPRQIVEADVQSYALNLDGKTLRIERPDPHRRIVSVYRGGGPRLGQGEPAASFDAYLLTQACARGAHHVPVRVRQVIWQERPVLQTALGDYPADLMVLATGVNSRAPLAPSFGYQPPRTTVMAQDEVLRPPTWPDDQVHVFFRHPPGLIFGALIPKGRYLNISLLGRRLTSDTVNEFIAAQTLDADLSAGYTSLCGCTPRVAEGAAPRYFGARWVAVGDAAVTRLYKDGIGSAFFTAQRAMHTAVHQGISRRAFHTSYTPYCRGIAADNLYGRLLYRLWSFTLHTPPLLRAWIRALHQEAAPEGGDPTGAPPGAAPDRRIHHRILWGMFTGDEAYRDLFRLALSPRAIAGLVRDWRRPQ